MRHLTDEDLAKYFDDKTQPASSSAADGDGWSLDDAFANPKQGAAVAAPTPQPRSTSYDPETPAPLKRPRLSERPMHPVRPVSRVSHAPTPVTDDLTWTGRDVQVTKKGGMSKATIMFMVGLVGCAVVVLMMSGSAPGTQLPQIGR